MTETLTFSPEDAVPDRDAAFENQGIPAGRAVPAKIDALYNQALDLLAKVAVPGGLLAEISIAEFATVYRGEGQNEPRTPVGDIFPRAEHLALFVVTLGESVSREIAACFRASDSALGAMLDSAASAAADKLAATAQQRFLEALSRDGRSNPGNAGLRYSPGYCGWHISGQKKLFEFLRPERIGVSLRDSFLMQPLKSVSGVVIVGPPDLHDIPMSYPACSQCKTRPCRDRIRSLLE